MHPMEVTYLSQNPPQLVPSAVIQETREEREERERKRQESDRRLRGLTAREPRQWSTAPAMLAWFFQNYEVQGARAIDPTREYIQGGERMDRADHASKKGRAYACLEALAAAQGNADGVILLWLHFRASQHVGYYRHHKTNTKTPKMSPPGVPVWELYREPQASHMSQRRAKQEFWRALHWVEEYALERGWIEDRMPRKAAGTQGWRRGE